MAKHHRKPHSEQRKRSGGGRRRGPQRRRHQPLSAENKFLREYEHLIKNHDDSRRRYFEQYHQCNQNKRRKLELIFFRAVEKLREFEDKITQEQWNLIKTKKHIDYQQDITYSTNHGPQDPEETCTTWDDSMMTATQLQRVHFSDDTTVSEGSMEDYQKYQQEKSS